MSPVYNLPLNKTLKASKHPLTFATRHPVMAILLGIFGFILVCVIALGLYVFVKLHPMGADVPLLKTPAWEHKELNTYEAQLLLRRETTAGGALLLKRTISICW